MHSNFLKKNIYDLVGNTPLVRIFPRRLKNINLYAKLEFYNPMGSVKDRPASYIIRTLLNNREIDKSTTLIESSSGNFGVALSAYSKPYGIKFYCVVDPYISATNELLIRGLGANLIKVTEPDENGGYLLTRIKKVKQLQASIPNSYWVNQYANPLNYEAYYKTLGQELCLQLKQIDYVFIGVSSCGTITGVSRKIKEIFPFAKIIAVDAEGSVIFGGAPKKRRVPGIGSSIVPSILQNAKIDEVIMVKEKETVQSCREILFEHAIFAGGSSGSVYAAVNTYFSGKNFRKKPNVVIIFPDRGDRYMTTIFNDEWVTSPHI
jgi:2,3-diaminopropionate biosynthesis protein SbnA